MATLDRSKLLMQQDLEKRARKKTSSDLRYPRKRSKGVNPELIPISKIKDRRKELRSNYVGGGLAMRGYGKAYMKGGKVK